MTEEIKQYFDRVIAKEKKFKRCKKKSEAAFNTWMCETDSKQNQIKYEQWKRLWTAREVAAAEWKECMEALWAFNLIAAYYEYHYQVCCKGVD